MRPTEATIGSGQATRERRAAGEPMADRAYAELRDRLVSLQIPPGAPINEDALGRELDMGRTPIREAIKRLALENLVTVFPRRGTFASEINITDLTAISDVRVQLEGHAAYRAAERITPAGEIELDELRARPRGQPRQRGRAVADGARRRRPPLRAPLRGEPLPRGDARTLLQPLAADLVSRARTPAASPGAGARARDLLEAIRAREPERSRAIMAEHIATFEREIRAVL